MRMQLMAAAILPAALLLMIGSSAEAGVAGNDYDTTVRFEDGETEVQCWEFHTDGDANYGGIPGEFNDFDLLIISFFNGEGSALDEEINVSGVSLFFGLFIFGNGVSDSLTEGQRDFGFTGDIFGNCEPDNNGLPSSSNTE